MSRRPVMPSKLVGDARLSHGARLMLVVLWGRRPMVKSLKVTLPKAVVAVTLNVSLNTTNRYIREVNAVGWARYDAGEWWMSLESDEGAA